MRKIILAEVIIVIALCLAIFWESSFDQSPHQAIANSAPTPPADGAFRRVVLVREHKLSPTPQPMPSNGPEASEDGTMTRLDIIKQFEEQYPPNTNPYFDCVMTTAPDMQQICDPLRDCNNLNCRTDDGSTNDDSPQTNAPKSLLKRKRPPTSQELLEEQMRKERQEKVQRQRAYEDCVHQTPLNMQDLCDSLKP
jgi:hypothetical protein